MGKYKKKLRAEKAKVKLKKKKLPKGQNITDTSFKVKKIITVEQLKKVGENEPVSSWNVPLKDLLIHLGHHNKSSRLNALNGIKEIVTNYQDVLKGPTLKSVIIKLLEMMSDMELKIRASAMNLLDIVFSQLNSNEMFGFHEILNINLACLMTHRQVAIQKDSLRLADIIIKYSPDSIKRNSKIIIVNFIRILSGYKYGAQSEIFLTKGSKRDLEENRIAIFLRLNKVLNICYPSEPSDEKDNIIYNVGDQKAFSKRILKSHLKKCVDLSEVFRPQGAVYNKMSLEEYEQDFKVIMCQIIPLIFETWAEFSPPHDNNGFLEECIIKDSTAKLLSLSLEIILVLCERSLEMINDEVNKLFINNFGNQFVKSFLSRFPYLPHIMERWSDRTEIPEEESAFNFLRHCIQQNLMICYIVYQMKLKISDELKKVLDNYVLQVLSRRNIKCEEILSKIIKLMIVVPSKQKRSDLFLEAAVKAFKHTTNKEFQKGLLQVLSKIAVCDSPRSNINPGLGEWISYLAKKMCKSKISFETLQTLSNLIRNKRGDDAIKEMESRFCEILKNLVNIHIEGCDQLLGKKFLINILFWCDNNVIRECLNNQILNEEGYPEVIKAYVLKVMNFKLNKMPC